MASQFRTNDYIILSLSFSAFILGIVWIFEEPAPKTTVVASLLWMFSPLVCTLLTIPILIVIAFEDEIRNRIEHSERINPMSKSISSSLASAAAWLMILQATESILRVIFSSAKPYDPDSEDMDAGLLYYGLSIIQAVITLLIMTLIAWAAGMPAYNSWLEWQDSWMTANAERLEMGDLNVEDQNGSHKA